MNPMRRINHPLARTPVVDAGKAIIQQTEGGFFIMLPTGKIEFRATQHEAKKLCHKFFKRVCGKDEISLGKIVWFFNAKSAAEEVVQPT